MLTRRVLAAVALLAVGVVVFAVSYSLAAPAVLPYEELRADLEQVCAPYAEQMAELRSEFTEGGIDVDTYVGSVAQTAADLSDDLDAVAVPASARELVGEFANTTALFALSLSDTPPTDGPSTDQALDNWASVAPRTGAPACAETIPVFPQQLEADADLTVAAPMSDTDAAGRAAEAALNVAGTDPENSFSLGPAFEEVTEGFTAVSGDTEPDVDEVSVSAARFFPAPAEDPGAQLYAVGAAVQLDGGGCVLVRWWGWPRPTAFEAVEYTGTCTGNTAAQTASFISPSGQPSTFEGGG